MAEKPRFARMLLVALPLLLAGTQGFGQLNVTLDFDTLPSSQTGWTYHSENTSASETDLFSVNGSVLTQDTLLSNSGSADTIAYYEHPTTGYLPGMPWILQFRARLLQSEPPNFEGSLAMDISLSDGVSRMSLIQEGVAALGDLLSVDTSEFHDYTFLWHPDSPTSLAFHLDGSFIADVSWFFQGFEGDSVVRFGDLPYDPYLQNEGNAHAEITHFEFTQVPEPGTTILFSICAVAYAAVFRTRNRRMVQS